MAYDMLVTAKNQLKAKKEIGQDSTLNPLDRFVINERRKSKTVTLDCVVYNLVDGVELGKMVANTLYDEINYFVELLPDILEGAIYLHEAGIEHNDIAAKRLANGRMRAVVIDYDSSIPLNPVATINPKTGKPTKPPTTKRLYFPARMIMNLLPT
ncbi:hypothetical protein BDF19DRAFT_493637 [Syncephalis fuscata]|nr:hypothetical protein BDF19DRAFT_493637 [Syncephalis fuscata]